MSKAIGGEGHPPPANGSHGILTTPLKQDHSRLRRTLNHAFSSKALSEQERYFQTYLQDLITGLNQQPSVPKDLVSWYNWTTFDAIGGKSAVPLQYLYLNTLRSSVW